MLVFEKIQTFKVSSFENVQSSYHENCFRLEDNFTGFFAHVDIFLLWKMKNNNKHNQSISCQPQILWKNK